MKAFSPDIFTEQTQTSLKEEAYKVIAQDKETISSILEAEDIALMREMEATRKYYISLIESQKQDLGLIDEIVGIAAIGAIIAGVIALLKKAISSITSGDVAAKIKAKAKEVGDKVKQVVGADDDDNIYCSNPYVNQDAKKGKIAGVKMDFNTFDKLASTTSVDVKIFSTPDIKLVIGRIPECDELAEALQLLNQATISGASKDMESANEAMNKAEELCNKVIEGMKSYDEKYSVETKSMTAKDYLTMIRPWLHEVSDKEGCIFEIHTAQGPLTKLVNENSKLLDSINKNRVEDENFLTRMQKLNILHRTANTAITSKIMAAYDNYWKANLADVRQMDAVTKRIVKTGNVSESTIFENEYYQNSPELQEYIFGEDTVLEDCSEIYTEFCQMIDDTNSRMNIYRHQTEMKAMNEEALIFSETGISDYEKFQRLQAVNEALGNKIKKAYYNTVAALKEIFRKFMEKLTANFTPTKTYLDRYKKIILGTPFNNYELKIQDMPTAIERIERATVPQLNYNALAQQAPDFGTFFGEVKKDLPENGDPKIKQSDVQTVGDANEWFKSYFCMQDHELNTNGKWFQQNVKNFYDFLYDINKINKSIRDSLKSIDDTVTSITKTAGSTQQEAVYSILYQKWFTLNENGVLVEVEVKAPENFAAPQGDQQQQTAQQTPANKVQNIKQNDDADNSNAKNDARGDVEARLKIYTDVCSSLLKAKMSAVEFVRNELMTVIRKHVQDHINTNPQQQQDQQQNQNDQQQQSQQTQQQPTKRPNVIQRAGNAVRAGANAFRGR